MLFKAPAETLTITLPLGIHHPRPKRPTGVGRQTLSRGQAHASHQQIGEDFGKDFVSEKALAYALRTLGLSVKERDTTKMKEAWKKLVWDLHPDRSSAGNENLGAEDAKRREDAIQKRISMVNAARDVLEERFGTFPK